MLLIHFLYMRNKPILLLDNSRSREIYRTKLKRKKIVNSGRTGNNTYICILCKFAIDSYILILNYRSIIFECIGNIHLRYPLTTKSNNISLTFLFFSAKIRLGLQFLCCNSTIVFGNRKVNHFNVKINFGNENLIRLLLFFL